ncbi:MAG: hypothetical protein ACK5NG_08720 [Chthoniobacterales bacterium]
MRIFTFLAALLIAQTLFWACQMVRSKWVIPPVPTAALEAGSPGVRGVYFADGDCYSRMERVRRVAASPGLIIQRHDFENFPDGVHSHTTALFDYIIFAFSKILPGVPAGVLPLEWAGAWISPLLGALLLCAVAVWGFLLRLRSLPLTCLLLAVSPILLHGFAVGRPDHQSLVTLLVGLGLLAEIALWHLPPSSRQVRWWQIVWGLAWGFALWASLYEPLIILLVVLLLRAVFASRAAWREWKNHLVAPVLAGVLLLISFLLEGLPTVSASGATYEEFQHWAQSIGELARVPILTSAFAWMGWLALPLPFLLVGNFLLARRRRSEGERVERRRECVPLFLCILFAVVAGLLAWHIRWGYFFVLVGAVALPWALDVLPWVILRYVLFFISLWPLAQEMERSLFPAGMHLVQRAEDLREAAMLRYEMRQLPRGNPNAILAPWWLTPEASYWAQLPGIAGSSHQSLPGTLDVTRFFMSTDDAAALEILKKRPAAWVIVPSSERVIQQAEFLFPETEVSEDHPPLVIRLDQHPAFAPEFLRLENKTPYFKIYRVVPLAVPGADRSTPARASE